MKESSYKAVTSSSLLEEAQKKITVVQCPACQTKFAVETASVAALELPRFHCSRCDYVFGLDRKALGLDVVEPPRPRLVVDEFTHGDYTPRDSESGDSEHRALEIPRAIDPQITSRPPHENLVEEEDVAQIPFNFDRAIERREEKFESPFDFRSEDLEPSWVSKSSDEPMGYDVFKRGSGESMIARDLFEESVFDEHLSRLAQGTPSKSDPVRSPWKACMVLSLPIIGFLALLLAFSFYATARPIETGKMASTLFPSIEDAAPADLYITKSGLKEVTLDSGDTIHVISGKLVNHTDKTFKDVHVEGLLFDKSGKLIASKKIDAASSLGKSRLQSLTLDMLDNLQETKSAKRFELRAGDEKDFTLAVPEGEENPAYFSTRVYSARS